MSLIEIFTDYILNKKSLLEYVEIRKTIQERGEFNDTLLLQAEENLKRLQYEYPEVHNGMYETLAKIYEQNSGLTVEYPIDFIRQILRMYNGTSSPYQVHEEYQRVLDHYHHNV